MSCLDLTRWLSGQNCGILTWQSRIRILLPLVNFPIWQPSAGWAQPSQMMCTAVSLMRKNEMWEVRKNTKIKLAKPNETFLWDVSNLPEPRFQAQWTTCSQMPTFTQYLLAANWLFDCVCEKETISAGVPSLILTEKGRSNLPRDFFTLRRVVTHADNQLCLCSGKRVCNFSHRKSMDGKRLRALIKPPDSVV